MTWTPAADPLGGLDGPDQGFQGGHPGGQGSDEGQQLGAKRSDQVLVHLAVEEQILVVDVLLRHGASRLRPAAERGHQ
jgi:hypothetical protein